jgi:uncharacterized membrane protein required for colicin V production
MAMTNLLVDSTIAVVILGSLYEGYKRGFLTSLFGLAGFTTVLLLCFTFGEALSRPLKPYIPLPTTYSTLAAYIAICFIISLVFYLLQMLLTKSLAKSLPPALDSIGGMFVGALRGAVFTALCLVILMLIANPVINEKISKESHVGATFFKKVSKVSPTVSEILTSSPHPTATKKAVRERSDHDRVIDEFDKK